VAACGTRQPPGRASLVVCGNFVDVAASWTWQLWGDVAAAGMWQARTCAGHIDVGAAVIWQQQVIGAKSMLLQRPCCPHVVAGLMSLLPPNPCYPQIHADPQISLICGQPGCRGCCDVGAATICVGRRKCGSRHGAGAAWTRCPRRLLVERSPKEPSQRGQNPRCLHSQDTRRPHGRGILETRVCVDMTQPILGRRLTSDRELVNDLKGVLLKDSQCV